MPEPLSPRLSLAAETVASKPPADGRLILPINRNWRYSKTPSDAAHAKDFDDSSFERVVVPHTNVSLPWHSFDDKLYEFVSVYRRHFKLPPEAKGKHVFVDFEGVMTASTVYLNGTRLGEYKGGFTPFSFDLTPQVNFDGDNVLVVDVDSTERADIPPFGYQIDYLTFGGLYREVQLRIVPDVFLENIFARPEGVLTSSPSLEVNCHLQFAAASKDPLSLEVSLMDGEKVLATGTQQNSAFACRCRSCRSSGVAVEVGRHRVVGFVPSQAVSGKGASHARQECRG